MSRGTAGGELRYRQLVRPLRRLTRIQVDAGRPSPIERVPQPRLARPLHIPPDGNVPVRC